MSDAHELIRQVMQGDGPPGGVDWHRLMAAVREVAREGGEAGTRGSEAEEDGKAEGRKGGMSAESEALLRDVIAFKGRIALAEGSELPHAMPPEEMLKAHAVQALARADLEKHRDAIQRVADAPESSERLAGIARMSLST
jgi:hypothetical protein